MMDKICLVNTTVVLETEVLQRAFILLQNGEISSIGQMDDCPELNDDWEWFDCTEKTVMPGMIDIHVHGAGGADFMDATPEAVNTIAETLAREGTTSYLATTMTNPAIQIEDALRNIAAVIGKNDERSKPEMLGIHLEGPFINEIQKGAQPASSIRTPDVQTFDAWQQLSGKTIRIVTLAPELDDSHLLLKKLQQQGVIASMGHTDATYSEVNAAVENGATHATHLFNGMRGLHHREPGVLGGVLMNAQVHVEVIPDGFHFHPDLLKMVLQMKGIDHLLVITDGMRAKGMPDGNYDLGGNTVTVSEGKCTLEGGTSLAGSIVTMNEARRNTAEWLGLSLVEQAKVTSLNQAKRLRVDDRKGSIEVGKDADLFVLDEQDNVALTICNGHIAYMNDIAFSD